MLFQLPYIQANTNVAVISDYHALTYKVILYTVYKHINCCLSFSILG